MNKLEAMTLRKQILSWRERWTKQIGEQLQADSMNLQSALEVEINAMSWRNVIFPKRFTRNRLEPIFTRWSEDKASELINDAEADLLKICEQSVPRHSASETLEDRDTLSSLKDMAGAALSGAAVIGAIPALVSFSFASVSVGGFLGLLGVTATVVVFRNVVIAVIGLGILALIAAIRIRKIKTNRQARLKQTMQTQIKEKILYSKKKKSLHLTLNQLIEDTANKLIGELKNVR